MNNKYKRLFENILNYNVKVIELFECDKHCCFASYWQNFAKYVIKRLFIEYLIKNERIEYFKYFNEHSNDVHQNGFNIKGLYKLESMCFALGYTHTNDYGNIYKNENFYQDIDIINSENLNEIINNEYDKFYCSFFFLLRYIYMNGVYI